MKKKSLLVLGIISILLCAATIVLTVYMGTHTSLVEDTGIKTGQQNYTIGYDAEKDIFFIGTRTGSLIAYNNATHEKMWEATTQAGQPFTAIKVRADADRVYAGNDDMNVYIYDINTGDELETIMANGRVVDLDISTDLSQLAVATRTNDKANVRVFDAASGDELFNNKYTYGIGGVLFTSDDAQLLVATKRGELMRMEFDGTVVTKVSDAVNSEIKTMKSAVDGEYMVVDINGNYAVFDENVNVLRKAQADMIEGSTVYSGGIDASGNIAIGTKQGYVYVMNPQDKLIYTYRQTDVISISDFATDGTVMYITGYGDFVDSIELGRLETIATLQSLETLIKVLLVVFAVAGILLIMSYFGPTYSLMRRFVKALWKYRLAYMLLVPTFVLLIMFNYTPVVMALTRAFTNWSVKNYRAADLQFVGLAQFRSALVDTHFLYGVRNLLIFMVTGFIKLLTMPMLAAYLVYSFKSDKKKYIYRFLFVLPIVVPGVVGSLMWVEIYNPGGGLDQILKALGRPEWIHVWLGEEKTALWSIVFMGIPYIGAMPFLLYYGGLTSIDASLYEAAKIDGASRWKIFWRVQLPMIMPQVKLLVMLQFIGSIQDYGGVYLMTGGGPGHSTYTPGLALYYDATANGQYGRACAMGIMMFVVIMIGTYFNNKIKAENYGS